MMTKKKKKKEEHMACASVAVHEAGGRIALFASSMELFVIVKFIIEY